MIDDEISRTIVEELKQKDFTGYLTDSEAIELEMLSHTGFIFLKRLNEDFNYNFVIERPFIRGMALLLASNYHIVHIDDYKSKGMTTNLWRINPHTKIIEDATYKDSATISLPTYLRLFRSDDIVMPISFKSLHKLKKLKKFLKEKGYKFELNSIVKYIPNPKTSFILVRKQKDYIGNSWSYKSWKSKRERVVLDSSTFIKLYKNRSVDNNYFFYEFQAIRKYLDKTYVYNKELKYYTNKLKTPGK